MDAGVGWSWTKKSGMQINARASNPTMRMPAPNDDISALHVRATIPQITGFQRLRASFLFRVLKLPLHQPRASSLLAQPFYQLKKICLASFDPFSDPSSLLGS